MANRKSASTLFPSRRMVREAGPSAIVEDAIGTVSTGSPTGAGSAAAGRADVGSSAASFRGERSTPVLIGNGARTPSSSLLFATMVCRPSAAVRCSAIVAGYRDASPFRLHNMAPAKTSSNTIHKYFIVILFLWSVVCSYFAAQRSAKIAQSTPARPPLRVTP